MAEENWKQKYLASLDKLEHQEKRWQATEALLKQGLTRVALAAEGQDGALDDDLALLRKILRKDVDLNQLEGVVNDLSQSVKRLDEARSEGAAVHSPQELLGHWLDSLSFPKSLNARIHALRKQIANTRSLEEMEAPLRELAQLINETLQHVDQKAPSGATGGGFFRRLFGSDEETKTATEQTSQDSIGKTTAPQISDFCIQLLDTLSLPAELNDEVESLKDKLGEGVSDYSVAPALTAIANLISAMRRQMEEENKELQSFLLQLGDNLKEIDQNLSGAQDSHKESLHHSRKLDAAVHAHVQDIQSTVDAAPESEALKQQIQSRLDAIRTHLDQFRETEETRQQQLEAQLAQLNNRVHGMESESEKLRRRLQEKHEQAVRDPLTGLYNRLAYDERIVQEFARWKRYGKSMVLMMIDVDHFKKVNDTYGHKAGDKALVLIADQLRNHLRESDFLARFGGEEFVVLMPETDLDAAVIAAEKLRSAVELCQFHYQNKQVDITVSAGLAQLRKEDSVESLFKRADEAMYRAKQAGRNRCLVEVSV
ncbi:MAG TPA: GGDEF domain-containing protein [Gammaproteobacteria bacterium]|nr:GGDEF domain-containing protein [Gammaproteobacteria bacterium]